MRLHSIVLRVSLVQTEDEDVCLFEAQSVVEVDRSDFRKKKNISFGFGLF